MTGNEKMAAAKAERLLRHIQDQIGKRQYLNAAHASSELSRTLTEAFSAVARDEGGKGPYVIPNRSELDEQRGRDLRELDEATQATVRQAMRQLPALPDGWRWEAKILSGDRVDFHATPPAD